MVFLKFDLGRESLKVYLAKMFIVIVFDDHDVIKCFVDICISLGLK